MTIYEHRERSKGRTIQFFRRPVLYYSDPIARARKIPLFPAVGATSAILGFTVGLGVVALLILILTRGRLGYQPLPSPQSSQP